MNFLSNFVFGWHTFDRKSQFNCHSTENITLLFKWSSAPNIYKFSIKLIEYTQLPNGEWTEQCFAMVNQYLSGALTIAVYFGSYKSYKSATATPHEMLCTSVLKQCLINPPGPTVSYDTERKMLVRVHQSIYHANVQMHLIQIYKMSA